MTGTTQDVEKPVDKNEHAQNETLKVNQPEASPHNEVVSKQEVHEPAGVERTRPGRVFSPTVDIYETDSVVVLVAEMPGVDENSVEVTLDRNVLTIYGHVDVPRPAGYSLAYAEYAVGDYMRSFTISNQLDWEHIEGNVRQGVLRLHMPKAGPAQTRKITINPA